MAKHDVYFSLGSNLGDRRQHLRNGLKDLGSKLNFIDASSVYETQSWGYKDDNPYLNIAARFKTDLDAHGVRKFSAEIEVLNGRLPKKNTYSSDYMARTLDIDILFFDQEILKDLELQIPHPRLHLRNFVLFPLADINKDLWHPILNQTIHELKLSSPDKSKIKRFARAL